MADHPQKRRAQADRCTLRVKDSYALERCEAEFEDKSGLD